MGVPHVGHPVANGLVDRVLEGLAAGRDRAHFCAKQAHSQHVRGLTCNIHRTHVNHTFQVQQSASGGSRHAVLPRTGFRHDTALPDATGQQGLPQGVIDLVSAGVGQIFAF